MSSKEQTLENRMRRLARLTPSGKRARFDLARQLARADRILREACAAYLAGPRGGRQTSPAAWLVDHYSFIRSQIRELREALPRRYYQGLPCVDDPERGLTPRPLAIAREVVDATDGAFDLSTVERLVSVFQEAAPLSLAELWALGAALKLALVERLADWAGSGPVGDVILTLRAFETVSWRDFVESVSVTESILRKDPSGHYANMTPETRDAYRHAVEAVARRAKRSEESVAQLAVDMAREASHANRADLRQHHAGYYLTGPGLPELRRRAGSRPSLRELARRPFARFSAFWYVGAIVTVTLLLLAALNAWTGPLPVWALVLSIVPCSQVALAIVNRLAVALVPPRGLPCLDFSDGVPEDCSTMIVVPTLLLSADGVEELLEDLEIRYLANRDPHVKLALLTDFADSSTPAGKQDFLVDLCEQGIRRLNARYPTEKIAPFFLFHRDRQWNSSEQVWMGRERKRGKLNDFNRLLVGEQDAFSRKVGDLSFLPAVRYVITLDSDTQLPRDTGRRMIGAMAHPLNRPILDPETDTVREGYAVLQPRISVSVESAGRSRLARIYSGDTGLDPYTTAVSDTYQDLFGRASFTGKGIYDVRVFERTAGRRFPDNTLLSHDLIEGEHARTGLLTDVELIDDYPATYGAYCKRKHRWARGDWQLLAWLGSRVPGPQGARIRNPLPLLSRWKLFDNLRRSLWEPCLFALLISGWFWLPGGPARWTAIAVAFTVLPSYFEAFLAAARLPGSGRWRGALRQIGAQLGRDHFQSLLTLVFLAHQACLMTDAIVRTLVRKYQGRKLLEWESMAQAELFDGRRLGLADIYLWAVPALSLGAVAWLRRMNPDDWIGLVIIELWILSPLMILWLDNAPVSRKSLGPDDRNMLRDLSVRTWRYFDRYYDGRTGLIPDNVQFEPPAVAHRISPTNLGLMLTAHLAAVDFGYLTGRQLAERLGKTLRSMHSMQRYRGHFYNWYDTRTLEALPPFYVSAVDSGNLAASLIALKQGCLSLTRQPLIGVRTLEGIRDFSLRLREELPYGSRSSAIMRRMDGLIRLLAHQPADLFDWEGVLSECKETTAQLSREIDACCSRLEPTKAGEVRDWLHCLVRLIRDSYEGLCELAPWLSERFEVHLRAASAHPDLADLMNELCRIPVLGELPETYRKIDECISVCLERTSGLPPAAQEILHNLRRELPDAAGRAFDLLDDLSGNAAAAAAFLEEMNFEFLYDRKRKLLRVGYDVQTHTPDSFYYDLLASEARTALFVAIAKGDIPREAWFHLGRKLTCYRGCRTLLSWNGTMFEYLMPALYMRTFENTLLDHAGKSMVEVQQRYAKERHVPWGISEAAYSERDSERNYQYYAFGVPYLRLNRLRLEELVLAPYASVLALQVDPRGAAANLRQMESRGWTGSYGFYESVDLTPSRMPDAGQPVLVQSYMTHHQAMILLALDNVLIGGAMQERFHAEPMVRAVSLLLQERVPALLGDVTGQEQEDALPVLDLPATISVQPSPELAQN